MDSVDVVGPQVAATLAVKLDKYTIRLAPDATVASIALRVTTH